MALNLALDVNRYVDYCNDVSEAKATLRAADRIAVPFVVLAELRAGFLRGSRSQTNQRGLSVFLQSDRVSVIFADDTTTHLYAMLYVDLRKAGTPIPTNDIWIAALVLQHDLVLFTRDRHFERVPRIARI